MNKTGAFRVPDQEPGRLHLYRVEGSGSRRGFTAEGVEWNEFDVDLFADEDSVECDMCSKPSDSGWRCGADSRELCKGCVVPHDGPFAPCVMFHKFGRRCWSEEMAEKGRGWTEEREKATVYTHPDAAEAVRQDFLEAVQKAIVIVPVAEFDEVTKQYREQV